MAVLLALIQFLGQSAQSNFVFEFFRQITALQIIKNYAEEIRAGIR